MYLGDNRSCAVWKSSKETIIRYTDEAMRYLFERGARLIIVALYRVVLQRFASCRKIFARSEVTVQR